MAVESEPVVIAPRRVKVDLTQPTMAEIVQETAPRRFPVYQQPHPPWRPWDAVIGALDTEDGGGGGAAIGAALLIMAVAFSMPTHNSGY